MSDDVRVIENLEGARTTPSIVAFADNGERLVGQSAKRQAVTNPCKHHLRGEAPHRPPFRRSAGGQRQGPGALHASCAGTMAMPGSRRAARSIRRSQISAFILGKMKETAEAFLGEKVSQAVITVPGIFQRCPAPSYQGCWTDCWARGAAHHQRTDGSCAGLRHGQKAERARSWSMIWAAVHSTYPSCVIGDCVFEVKSTNGDTFLGGEDFDARVIDLPRSGVQARTGH